MSGCSRLLEDQCLTAMSSEIGLKLKGILIKHDMPHKSVSNPDSSALYTETPSSPSSPMCPYVISILIKFSLKDQIYVYSSIRKARCKRSCLSLNGLRVEKLEKKCFRPATLLSPSIDNIRKLRAIRENKVSIYVEKGYYQHVFHLFLDLYSTHYDFDCARGSRFR